MEDPGRGPQRSPKRSGRYNSYEGNETVKQQVRQFKQKFQDWISLLSSQAILLIILLLSLILLLTVGVTFLAYQRVAQSLAESRDQELAKISAERLSESMLGFAQGLRILADQVCIKELDTDSIITLIKVIIENNYTLRVISNSIKGIEPA